MSKADASKDADLLAWGIANAPAVSAVLFNGLVRHAFESSPP